MNMNTTYTGIEPADHLASICAGYFARARPNAPLNPYQFYIEHREECLPVVPLAEPREARQCMTNSFHLTTELLASGRDAFFVEGYLLISGCPLTPHGWVGVQNGEHRAYIDPTMVDVQERHSFFGVRIPNDVLLKCCDHEAWTISVGCLQTMAHFSDVDLAWAKDLLEEAQYA